MIYVNLENKTNLYELENYIASKENEITEKLLVAFIEGIDLEYKFFKERKIYSKKTRSRTLLTSIGYIDVKFTFYKHKQTKK